MTILVEPPISIPPVYEVTVSLKNGENINGYCRGRPYPASGDWLHLKIEIPCEGEIVVKIEEIVYVLFRPRREKE